jgi:hypothetical protein
MGNSGAGAVARAADHVALLPIRAITHVDGKET